MTTWLEAQSHEKSFWHRFLTDELRCRNRDMAVGFRMSESWLCLSLLGYGWIVERNLSTENPLRGKILDVGCGPISVLEHAVGCSVVAIDPALADYHRDTPELVVLGQSDNVEYRSTTIQEVQETDFDIVWCVNVLDHTDNWQSIVDNFARVLKPEGLLLLSTDVRTVVDQWHIATYTEYQLGMELAQHFDTDFVQTSPGGLERYRVNYRMRRHHG